MFTHIMVGANDIEASKVFYDAVLGTLDANLEFYQSIQLIKKDIFIFMKIICLLFLSLSMGSLPL